MGKARIKICGLTTAETLDAAIAARADYFGLMFVARSPRFAAPEIAASLGARAAGRIGRVGVFLDQDDSEIAGATAAAGLDVLQLHGGESPARCAELRARHGLPVWKVLSVADKSDLAAARTYAGAADLVLLDAKTPKGTLPGGLGLSFDWDILADWRAPLPWGLAGGLNPANVADAVRRTGTSLVDASSGLETAPGQKDCALIARFCEAVRSA